MAEYERGEARAIKPGEPIEFTNFCKSAFAVGTGIIFKEDGQYIVSVGNNRITVQEFEGRPVVRGKWQYQTMTVPGGKGQTYGKWRCSACRKKSKDRSPFCPLCGADMRPPAE